MNITHSEESLVLRIKIDEVEQRRSGIIAEICKIEDAFVLSKNKGSIENVQWSHDCYERQKMCARISSYQPCCYHKETKPVYEEKFVKLPPKRCIAKELIHLELLFVDFFD